MPRVRSDNPQFAKGGKFKHKNIKRKKKTARMTIFRCQRWKTTFKLRIEWDECLILNMSLCFHQYKIDPNSVEQTILRKFRDSRFCFCFQLFGKLIPPRRTFHSFQPAIIPSAFSYWILIGESERSAVNLLPSTAIGLQFCQIHHALRQANVFLRSVMGGLWENYVEYIVWMCYRNSQARTICVQIS